MVLRLKNDLRSWWVFHILFLLYSPQKMANDVGMCVKTWDPEYSCCWKHLVLGYCDFHRWSPSLPCNPWTHLDMLQALLLEADCPIITAHFNCCLDACHVAGIDGMFTRVPGLVKSSGVNGFCAVESIQNHGILQMMKSQCLKRRNALRAHFLNHCKEPWLCQNAGSRWCWFSISMLGASWVLLVSFETVPTLTLCHFLRFTVLEISLIFLVSSICAQKPCTKWGPLDS